MNQAEAVIARDLVIWLRNHAARHDLTHVPVVKPSIGVICMYKAQAWLVSKLLADAGVEAGTTSSATSSSSSSSGRGAGSGFLPTPTPNPSGDDCSRVEGSEAHDTVVEWGSFEYHDSDDGGEGKSGDGSISETSHRAINEEDREISGVSSRSTHGHAGELRVSTVDAFQVILTTSLCAVQCTAVQCSAIYREDDTHFDIMPLL